MSKMVIFKLVLQEVDGRVICPLTTYREVRSEFLELGMSMIPMQDG